MTKLKTVLVASVALLLTACGGASEGGATATNPSQSDGTLIVAGSTTVTPLMRELQAVFEASQDDIRLEIQEIGTSAGVNATIDGISDIAMASRALKDSEIEAGLTPVSIAMDGVAIIVHNDNPVDELTLAQIEAIFRGEITNWSEVGGNDATITVVSREAGSGMRDAFEEFTNVRDEMQVGDEVVYVSAVYENAVVSSGTGAVLATVSSNENAIGYLTTGVAKDVVRAVGVDGVHFSKEAAKDGSYALANIFYIATMPDVSDDAQTFVDWIISPEGQSVVESAEYIALH